jgi:hypothetical protein
MELRIQLAAGVVVINGDHQILRGPVIVGLRFPNPGGSVRFEFTVRSSLNRM